MAHAWRPLTERALRTLRLLLVLTGLCQSVILLASLPPQASARNADRSRCRLGGVVRDAATGAPLGNAVVWVREAPAGTNPRFGMTDETGRYAVDGLAPGSYLIHAEKAGYVTGVYRPTRVSKFGTSIEVAPGEMNDSADVVLARASSLAGRVTAETGEAVVGVVVRALRFGMAGSRRIIDSVATTTTDDRGAYVFAVMAPGDYVVAVPTTTITYPSNVTQGSARREELVWRAGDGVTRTAVPRAGAPDTFSFARWLVQVPTALPIPPPDGDRFFITLPAFSSSASVLSAASSVHIDTATAYWNVDVTLRTAEGRRVSGVLQATRGAVGGVRLRLAQATGDHLAELPGLEVATTVSEPDGAFVFVGVPEGTYLLSADVSPLVELELWAAETVEVGGADVDGVVVSLHPVVAASGTIAWEGGQPPAEPIAFAIESATAPNARLSSRGFDDGRGHFVIDRLQAGRYFITPAAPIGWRVKSMTLNGVDLTDRPIPIGTQDIDGLRVVMTRTSSGLTGQVHAGFGESSSDSTILVFPADASQRKEVGQLSPRFKTAIVDGAGAFALQGVPAGDYLVVALPGPVPYDWQNPEMSTRLAALAAHVRLTDGTTAVLDLKLRTLPAGK